MTLLNDPLEYAVTVIVAEVFHSFKGGRQNTDETGHGMPQCLVLDVQDFQNEVISVCFVNLEDVSTD